MSDKDNLTKQGTTAARYQEIRAVDEAGRGGQKPDDGPN
jgi:hypothetical protein